MGTLGQPIHRYYTVFLIALLLIIPLSSKSQIPVIRNIKALTNDAEPSIRPWPVCDEEVRLQKKYADYSAEELVKELLTEDSIFYCPNVRGTTRMASKRWVIQALITNQKNEALPYLIKVIKNESPQLSAVAMEIIQFADRKLLRPHSALFLKKMQSIHAPERNRSIALLQRIKDEHIEQVIVKRWDKFSSSDIKDYRKSSSLRGLFELMLYSIKDRALLEKSIIHTLTQKRLDDYAMREYLRVLDSFMYREHDIQIEEEVLKILLKTNDRYVASSAAEVLSDSRTAFACHALIQALDSKNDEVRAEVAGHLIRRYDFIILEQKEIIENLMSDDSPKVINRTRWALSYKEPDAKQSAFIVNIMLKHLAEAGTSIAEKVSFMMQFYARLDQSHRDSIVVKNLDAVLNSIELALNDSVYNRGCQMTTERLFEEIYSQKEMDISHLEFWKRQLER